MELVLLATLGGIFILSRQNSALATATQPQQETPPSSAGKGVAVAGAGTAVGGAVGEATAVAGAAAAGAAIGTVVNNAINPNGGPVSKTTAQVGGAVIGGSAALLAFGTISLAVFGALFFTVAWVYAVVIFVEDKIALAYGQAGARKDFQAQWDKLHADCFQKIRMQADPLTTDKQIERQLIPFIDGHMKQAALLQYRVFMRGPRGIGVNLVDHFWWGYTRGKFICLGLEKDSPENPTKTPPTANQINPDAPPRAFPPSLLRSNAPDFAATYCPPNEAAWVSP